MYFSISPSLSLFIFPYLINASLPASRWAGDAPVQIQSSNKKKNEEEEGEGEGAAWEERWEEEELLSKMNSTRERENGRGGIQRQQLAAEEMKRESWEEDKEHIKEEKEWREWGWKTETENDSDEEEKEEREDIHDSHTRRTER